MTSPTPTEAAVRALKEAIALISGQIVGPDDAAQETRQATFTKPLAPMRLRSNRGWGDEQH